MTVEEFDIRFDILYNNLASNAAPALNAYEKSVFLSQAQRDIIIELYNGRSIPGISFESTEEARAYLRPLIKHNNNIAAEITQAPILGHVNNVFFKEYIADIEDFSSIWFITNEQVILNKDEITSECDKIINPIVIPVQQDELENIFRNPFKRPSKNKVLKLDVNNKIYLYSVLPLESYSVMYITKPEPIILKGINDSSLTIDSVTCKDDNIGSLPEMLHQSILDRAVALAKQAYLK